MEYRWFLGQARCSIWYYNSRYCNYLSKPTEYTIQRVNPNINYGLWFIIMYQHWLISYSKWTPLDINTGEGNGTPLQYSCLENPMDGGVWYAAVHGVAKSRTRLSDFTFTFHFHALEKEMATHSIVLAWRIPGTGEPGGLPSMGWHRVGHDWSNLAAAAAANKM